MWITILRPTTASWDDALPFGETARHALVVLVRVSAVLLGFGRFAAHAGGTIMAVRGQRCIKISPP
jgi:hypothetical protein